MIYDLTYTDREADKAINQELGKAFGLIERVKLRGIGSERMIVSGGTGQVDDIFTKNYRQNFANVELRPKGVLIRIRYRLEIYAFSIPYAQCSIFKSDVELTFHRGGNSIRLRNYHRKTLNKAFVRKLIQQKSSYLLNEN